MEGHTEELYSSLFFFNLFNLLFSLLCFFVGIDLFWNMDVPFILSDMVIKDITTCTLLIIK